MSYWTGPCCRHTYFLQKNGGEGCHTGQDLVIVLGSSFLLLSYKRMEEKGCHIGQDLVIVALISYKRMGEEDVIADRTLSIVNVLSM